MHPGFGAFPAFFTALLPILSHPTSTFHQSNRKKKLTTLPAIPTVPGGGNHTPEFTAAAATPEAHAACLDVSKALALTGVRVVADEVFERKVSGREVVIERSRRNRAP